MIYSFTLSDPEFRMLRDLIHEKYGILFREDKDNFFQMKLYPLALALGFGSFAEYIQHLRYADAREEEWGRAISSLTNNETYFFREVNQLETFRDHLLPSAAKRRTDGGNKTLKILSAGCSTGEEVYTLSMLIYETGLFFWGWGVSVVGMDVDRKALDVARSGLYYDRSLRMTPPQHAERFFNREEGAYRVRDSVSKMASFREGNLMDPRAWDGEPEWDFILCRNVLIYFSEPMVKRMADHFYRALLPGGFLLLGHSESLTGITDSFSVVRCPGGLVYQKPERAS